MTAVVYSFHRSHSSRGALAPFPRPADRAAIYRRRRLAVGAGLLLIVLALGMVIAPTAISQLSKSSAPQLIGAVSGEGATTWTVREGDTLWTIATATHPGEDPRRIVSLLVKEGASSNLQPGDVVRIP